MTASGIVEAVREWEETPEGRRRPSDKQARNEDTGMPLWEVEVLYIQRSFGRPSTVTARVVVEAVDEPRPSPMTPIGFTGLRVETRVNKAGGWTEFWSADAIIDGENPGASSSNGSTAAAASGSSKTSTEKSEKAA
jgi:hypothetical protein